MGNIKKFDPKDDQWIRDNFEKLVEKHAGEFVAVARRKISFGKTRVEAEKKIAREVKDVLPSVMQVPHKRSLTCAL